MKYSCVWHCGKLPPLFSYLSHALMALHFLREKMRADHHHPIWKQNHSYDEAERVPSFPLPVGANLLSQTSTNAAFWDRFLQVFACVSQKSLWCWLLRWITWTLSTWILAAGTQTLQFLPSLAVAMMLSGTYMPTYTMVGNKSWFLRYWNKAFFFLSTDLAVAKPMYITKWWGLCE